MALVHVERPSDGAAEGLLVLHHGRGSDEQDLLGLADVLDPARRLHVVSPRAPLTLPGWPGYHWYVVPRVGYPDPETFRASYGELSRAPRRAVGAHGRRPRAHRAGRLLDGVGHELRARPRPRPSRPGGHPRLQRLHPHRRGLGAGPGRPRRHAGLHRARAPRPGDERGVRPPGPRADRGRPGCQWPTTSRTPPTTSIPEHLPPARDWLDGVLPAP